MSIASEQFRIVLRSTVWFLIENQSERANGFTRRHKIGQITHVIYILLELIGIILVKIDKQNTQKA